MAKDARDDFDKWTDQWAAAMETDEFKNAPKPPTPAAQHTSDFFGQTQVPQGTTSHQADVEYWNQVYRLSRGEGDPLESEDGGLVTEEKEATAKQLDAQKKVAQSVQNPVPYWTLGKDQDTKIPQVEEIQELADMKVSLEELESKLNANEALGKSGADIQKKIDGLKTKIDELSDALTPSRFSTDHN